MEEPNFIFFEFKELDRLTNYSMIYIRFPSEIENLNEQLRATGAIMHPNGKLEIKPWGVKEFAILDPNHTLLTFGQLQKTEGCKLIRFKHYQ
jgi:hypothetical protein